MTPLPPGPTASPVVWFSCPLCVDAFDHEIIISAELDRNTRPVTVADLDGCEHAEQFGEIGALTPAQEARLIETALDALDALPSRRRRRPGLPHV